MPSLATAQILSSPIVDRVFSGEPLVFGEIAKPNELQPCFIWVYSRCLIPELEQRFYGGEDYDFSNDKDESAIPDAMTHEERYGADEPF